jgi:hypothetical protein
MLRRAPGCAHGPELHAPKGQGDERHDDQGWKMTAERIAVFGVESFKMLSVCSSGNTRRTWPMMAKYSGHVVRDREGRASRGDQQLLADLDDLDELVGFESRSTCSLPGRLRPCS